jgi:hypothetical protein
VKLAESEAESNHRQPGHELVVEDGMVTLEGTNLLLFSFLFFSFGSLLC